MCLAGIARLEAAWDDGAVRVGRLEDGDLVTLAFVPEAEPGSFVLVQLGIPVEVLDPGDAADALALREASTHEGGTR